MKFGYRDRVILLVAVVLIIFGIGIFVFIKPKWEKLNRNQKNYEDMVNQWDIKLAEFDRIPGRQDMILEKYENSKKTAEEFTSEKNSVELDEYIRETFINTEKHIEDKVKLVGSLSVADQGTTSMNYNFKTPSIVTYPLFELADMDGSIAAATAEKLHDSAVLASRTPQTIGSSKCELLLEINREDTMALIDAVKKYAKDHKDAMLINRINFKDYGFNEDAEEQQQQTETVNVTDEDGNQVQQEVQMTPKDEQAKGRKGYTDVTIGYELYNMQAPTKPDVGPKYDKTIWDTEEWRSIGAEAAQ